MSNKDIHAFRLLIKYALQESTELRSPVVSFLLSMADEELDKLLATNVEKISESAQNSHSPTVG